MDCVDYTDLYLADLTRLLNTLIAGIPPCLALSEAQVSQVLGDPTEMWRAHYSDESAVLETQTLCVVENGKLLAAGQWAKNHPNTSKNAVPKNGLLLWMVAEPGSFKPAAILAQQLMLRAYHWGAHWLTTTRFCFGAGWMGIPSEWTEVNEALHLAGFTPSSRWQILSGSIDLPGVEAITSPANLQIEWQINETTREWDLCAKSNGELAGECSAWDLPPFLKHSPGAAGWCTVEWLGVEPAFQRQGLGRRLLVEQARLHKQRGIMDLILWTETSNQAMLALGRSLGLHAGPVCVDFDRQFNQDGV